MNYSDGFFTNNTDFTSLISSGSFSSWSVQNVNFPAIGSQSAALSDIVNLYAAKHNPFVYFRDVQEGTNPDNSLRNVVGFEGLFQDLGSGSVPNFSLIAPNQCNGQHGRSNAGPFCNFDENDNGTQTGLNQALIFQDDVTVNRIVTAIKNSPAWNQGNNAIVIVWDENDYTATPNQVLMIVDTNHGSHGVVSGKSYNHFSLLKTFEAGFGLPCLNHACDSSVNVMTDLSAVVVMGVKAIRVKDNSNVLEVLSEGVFVVVVPLVLLDVDPFTVVWNLACTRTGESCEWRLSKNSEFDPGSKPTIARFTCTLDCRGERERSAPESVML